LSKSEFFLIEISGASIGVGRFASEIRGWAIVAGEPGHLPESIKLGLK